MYISYYFPTSFSNLTVLLLCMCAAVFAPVGSKAQHWHVDDAFDNKRIARHRYFTILIHLNPIDAFCGGTEIWSESMNRGDMVTYYVCVFAVVAQYTLT